MLFVCVAGVISVADPSLLDRETQPTLSLRLIATDGGVNAMNSVLFITVDLDDINDNAPYFVGTPYSTNIAEVMITLDCSSGMKLFKMCMFSPTSATLILFTMSPTL